MNDRELLASFREIQDEGAFEAMVSRHGPMVLRVCRDILADPDAADDAFQATFLLLVRRVGAIREPDFLGRWLHGVATRVAIRSKVRARRRGAIERMGMEMESVAANGDPTDQEVREIRPILHAEIEKLPAKLRAALVLCYMEGRTYESAAKRLRLPLGTLKGRLTRGRELLRSRLARRGVTASALALILLLTEEAPAVSAELIETTVNSARGHVHAQPRVLSPLAMLAHAGLARRLVLMAGLVAVMILAASSLSKLSAASRRSLKPLSSRPPAGAVAVAGPSANAPRSSCQSSAAP